MDNGKKAVRKFGNRLRQLRKDRSWSQQEMAARLDVEQSYTSGLERGVFGPSFPKLAKLADIFELTLEELCEGS